ncbi:MAG: hypothetical protein WDM90_01115 [Ferruginibacter sp.]
MNNHEHDVSLMMAGIYISWYLRTLPRLEAIQQLSTGYSKEALTSLYNTAMQEEHYEVCSIIQEILGAV